jgi:ribosome biogenesis GTPase
LRHDAVDRSELPAVGDWVVLAPRPGENWATIHGVLPRRSAFTRKVAGYETQGQVLAANIDVVWIVGSLTRELSARRIERYLAVAWESGAAPVIVLTKADLGEADAGRIAEVEAIAFGTPIHVTSAVTGEGLDELRASLSPNLTAAVLGVSGVGKSTLVNALLGEERMATHETDSADVGRHTTSHRELVQLPSGGMVIDTPGLRELVPWDDEHGMDAVFGDINVLAAECGFRDCSHRAEPGCAIKAAIANGDLDPARLRSYEKMQRELSYVERRKRGRAAINSKRKWKDLAKVSRQRERS